LYCTLLLREYEYGTTRYPEITLLSVVEPKPLRLSGDVGADVLVAVENACVEHEPIVGGEVGGDAPATVVVLHDPESCPEPEPAPAASDPIMPCRETLLNEPTLSRSWNGLIICEIGGWRSGTDGHEVHEAPLLAPFILPLFV
jgi:hypothetical protein